MFSQLFFDFLGKVTPGFFSEAEQKKMTVVFIENRQNVLLTQETENNLIRILEAFYDPRTILRECLHFPHFAHILMQIAGHSNFLADIVVRDPGPLYGFLTENLLDNKIRESDLKNSMKESIANYGSFDRKISFIKSIKRREILKIALRDMLEIAPLQEIIEEISILARVITDQVFSVCYAEESLRFCGKELPKDYTIIALGKMGGNELNYSSDIDLMVFYKRNKKIGNKIEYYEILTKSIQLFTGTMAHPDENGFLYRVDFRLRPDGKSAPLCRTLNDTLRYYESRGETWERQMLIKAGFITGSRNLYKSFISYITPFIYPSSAFSSPIEQIKKIRGNILKTNRSELNIKLSSGGIRDIEFGVQALQLLAGGKLTVLRTGNTLEALHLLFINKMVTSDEFESLKNIYIHYRRIEHYLQLMNDQQTHTIPIEGELLDKLSAYLGYNSPADFFRELNQFKAKVKEFYSSITGESAVLNDFFEFDTIPFADPVNARKNYLFLKEGKNIFGERNFDTISLQAFNEVEKKILNELRTAHNPDVLLTNFVKVLRQVSFPSLWYEQFRNNHFFGAFVTLCTYDARSLNYLPEDTNLQEKFLTGRVFEPFALSIDMSMKEIYFSLSVRLLLKIITPKQFSQLLSRIIKDKLQETLKELISDQNEVENICVLIAGSISTETMSYSSDVDLIFIKADDYNPPEIQDKYFSLLRELKIAFFPLELDARLRPEGRTSMMIFNISTYKEYLINRARTWEFQAMTKMSPIFGAHQLYTQLKNTFIEQAGRISRGRLSVEISAMRKKLASEALNSNDSFEIKRGNGGYVDIEFIIQFLILSESAYLNNILGMEFYKIIRFFSEKSLIPPEKGADLEKNYSFLKAVEIYLQILEPADKVKLKKDSKAVVPLAHLMSYSSPEEFRRELLDIRKSNTSMLSESLDRKNG